MSIVLDPGKNYVALQVMYIEEIDEKHQSTKFRFIKNRSDFDEWKRKGYVTSDEMAKTKLDPGKKAAEPGMPESPPIDPDKVIHILRTWWSRMTWKEQNLVYSKCFHQSTDSEGKTRADLDMIAFRDYKLKTCLKKWDLKDESGNDVKVSDNIIDNLYPEVAQELLNQFELITEATDEEMGE